MKKLILILIVLATAIGFAQSGKRELTVDWVMQGHGLFGWTPQNIRWSRDSQKVYFEWKKYDAPLLGDFDTWEVNRDGSNLRKLSEEEKKDAPPLYGDLAPDFSATVYEEDGDIYLYNHQLKKRRVVTRTTDAESSPFFFSAQQVTFQRNNNLFLMSLTDGSLEQLTDIRPEGSPLPPEEQKGTESQEELKKESRRILATMEESAKKREEKEAKKKAENPRKPWILPARHTVSSIRLSGDGKFVIAVLEEEGEKDKKTIVPNYVTESSYTEDIPARDKVGDHQALTKIAVLDRTTGEQKWVDLKDSLDRPLFNRDRTKAVIRSLSADNKDLRFYAFEPDGAKVRELAHIHDDAWMNYEYFDKYGLLDDGTLWFVSEEDGYAHLYSVPYAGGERKQLTSGKWEIRNVEISDDRKTFYLTTAEANAAEDQLYAMSVNGGDRKRLTQKPGGHETVVSPDGQAIADLYGYANTPTELWVGDQKVTQSPSAEFSTYNWIDPPLVEIPARDGVKIPARIYKPASFKKGGPLVVFVHGAGYLQNAHKKWSYYAREYMFHHLLRDRGYMVLDIDFRASAGYGRDWRTAVYRYMGGKDLDDQVDAVKWAITNHGVDPKRVGIYGGSYGGFITLMAMFTQPDVFAAGAALRPVTDWAHYNHPYTSNILNLPQKDQEAYRKSSPINFAEGLKGSLLICHGMIDTNVHYQDSVRLAQRLIELRKENWELAGYPVEDHAFIQPTSWADEYRRVLKLFETTIGKKN